MLLKDILYGVALSAVSGHTNIMINQIHFDSRKVEMDDVFVAIRGLTSDGHEFIAKAVESGVIAIVCEEFPELMVNGITYLKVENTNSALAIMAGNFYGNPSKNLKLVGVTGTNGKTTVTTLLYNLLKKAGYKVGLLSTIKVMVDYREYPAAHTTPDVMAINKYMSLMNEEGVEFCLMESTKSERRDCTLQGPFSPIFPMTIWIITKPSPLIGIPRKGFSTPCPKKRSP